VMGNHGVLVIGDTVAETFNRMYYFERAAETYIRALQTGQPLRILPHDIAEKTAQQIEAYPEQDLRHLSELKALLERDGSDFAS
jgi:ribulose-5-phosphate 4-epimerase/fuculose-1-phosphate aldolase